MFLSIIIPYYNCEKWISTCLDSLLHQDIDEDDYEIIVIDDGSTHNLDILKDYKSRHRNIKYVYQNNARQSAARNNGLHLAQGKYVFFCDSDDFVTENVFGNLRQIVVNDNPDILIYGVKYQEENETVSPQRNWTKQTFETGIDYINRPSAKIVTGAWGAFYLRSFLQKHQISFDENMIMREDSKFYLESLLHAGRTIIVDTEVYHYVQHPISIIHSIGKKENHEKYIDNILSYIHFLHGVMSGDIKNRLSVSGINTIKDSILYDSYIVLHNTARYGSMKRNINVIKQMANMGEYPLQYTSKNKEILLRIMNHKYLWLALCMCICVLPNKIRFRYL